MQNRYVGDIGDFGKYSLLNALSEGQRLGVAWYRFPNESHNADGKHVQYLCKPEKWRDKDPHVFNKLKGIVESKSRSIQSVLDKGVLRSLHASSDVKLAFPCPSLKEKDEWRRGWFEDVKSRLSQCDIVFADPDNGFFDDKKDDNKKFKYTRKQYLKSLPLSEALELAEGRTAVFYHHNTRRKGGHEKEIEFWRSQLQGQSFSVRFRAYSPRTFFILNPKPCHFRAVREWKEKFREYTED